MSNSLVDDLNWQRLTLTFSIYIPTTPTLLHSNSELFHTFEMYFRFLHFVKRIRFLFFFPSCTSNTPPTPTPTIWDS